MSGPESLYGAAYLTPEQPNADAAADSGAAADAAKGKGRNVKTPLQKEVLEASYAIDPTPNLQHRKALAERIGLTEEQVNSWFTGKRRRDKKKAEATPGISTGPAASAQPSQSDHAAAAAATPAPATTPPGAAAAATPASSIGAAAGYTSGHESDAYGASSAAAAGGQFGISHAHAAAAAPVVAPSSTASKLGATPSHPAAAAGSGGGGAGNGKDVSAVQAELLELAKKSLPVAFREDGPQLAFIFDSVPAPNTRKGMQAAALIAAKRKKLGATPAEAVAAAAGEQDEEGAAKKPRLGPHGSEVASAAAAAAAVDDPAVYQQALQQQAALHASSTAAQVQGGRVLMKAERERQKEELRRQKEMEKARAAQEREAKKREAQLEREKRAEEKRKAAEDKRREKELQKALIQQERAAGRGIRARAGGEVHHHHHGPPDDLELEQEALMVRARATAAAQAAARGLDPSAVEPVVGPPPEFPPPYLLLQPAFPAELGDALGQQLIEAWGFVTGFADLLGSPRFSMEALLAALLQGASSPLLGLVHILLLRQAQADMEEAHATGILQSPQLHLSDRTLVAAAQRLEEAWAWGLDPDLWRAHLGPNTWPEVLRQQALASGAGGSRFHLKAQVSTGEATDGATTGVQKAKRGRAPRGSVGFEGEDVVSGWGGDGPLKLQAPDRFAPGTWMAAAWRVLAEVGPEGTSVAELVRIISERGLRSLAGSRNPEASLTGALSRDILFHRLRPGKYALQSIVTYHQRMQAIGKPTVVEPPQDQQRQATAMEVDGQDDSDEDDESDDEEAFARAPEDPTDSTQWAIILKHDGYDALTLAQRLEALLWLIGVVTDGPAVRAKLEAREKEAANLKKQLLEDARAEKKRRQEEAAARARAAAEQAQARLEELQRKAAAGESVAPEAMAAAAAAAAALSSAAGVGGAPGAAASRAVTPAPAALATTAAGDSAATPPAVAPPASEEKPAEQQPAMAGQPEQQQQQQPGTNQSPDVKQEQQQQPSPATAGLPPLPPSQQEQSQPPVDAQRVEQEAELAAESSRRAARAEAIRRLEELNVLRLEPLGLDRRHNRYWLLVAPDFAVTSAYYGVEGDLDAINNKSGEVRDGNTARIYVEPASGGRWRVMLRAQQLDQLKQVLEPRGVREGALHQALLRVEHMVRAAMPGTQFTMPKSLDQQPLEQRQAALAASAAWLSSQPLLAAMLTSSSQEAANEAALQPNPVNTAAGPDSMDIVLKAEDEEAATAAADEQCAVQPVLVQLKRDMLRVECLLADTMQHTCHSFDHQAWVHAVASAPDLPALRTCLAQLETALAHEGQEEERGKKTRGQIKAEIERISLLSPAWKVIASTPCVKGAWLSCSGAEVPAAMLGMEGLLQPVQLVQPPALESAAADPAAPASAEQDHSRQQQQQDHAQLQLQQQQHAADLSWLPATAPALSLRLAALDAVLQYPQLGPHRTQLVGREIMARYRYIVKPAPIYAAATLDQLLSQEVAAAKLLKASADQQQQDTKQEQQATSETPPAAAEGQRQEENQRESHSQQLEVENTRDEQKQKQQQQMQQWQQEQLSFIPTLQDVLAGPIRVAYGYSLAGRGLLQLLRGLPPYADWTQQAHLDEFSITIDDYKKAVQAAHDDGTFNMTIPEVHAAKEAEAARLRAEEEARKAAKEAAKAAAREAAAKEAAAAAEQQAAESKPAAAAAAKGKMKIKLSGQAGAAGVAAKAGKPPSGAAGEKGHTAGTKADGGAKHHQQQQHHEKSRVANGTAAMAPKLRIKGAGKMVSREGSPAAERAPQPAAHSKQEQKQTQPKSRGLQQKGAAGGGGRLTGRLRLRQTGKESKQKDEEEQVDEALLDSSEDDD